jgi:single-strand DNA-binding protein
VNKIILSGRLCNDTDIRTTADGKTVARFNFAVNRRFKREGQPEADFFQCVAFGKTAEVLDRCNVNKGTKLLLWGEMQNNDFTDAEGIKHFRMQVLIEGFEFCESKSSGGSASADSSASDSLPSEPSGFVPAVDDDLPF